MADDSEAYRKAEIAKSRNLTVTFAPSQGPSLTKSSKIKQISPPSSMSSSSSSSSISSSVFLSPTSSSSSAGLSANSSFSGNKQLSFIKHNQQLQQRPQHPTQPTHHLGKHKSAFFKPTSKLVRSTTENFISFLANDLHSNQDQSYSSEVWSAAVSSPFGSILSPYNPSLLSSRLKFAIQHDEEKYDESRRRNPDSLSEGDQSSSGDSESSKVISTKRYPVDVLLMRSDVPASKKMPDEWFELNQKYPEVCFCGKVRIGQSKSPRIIPLETLFQLLSL